MKLETMNIQCIGKIKINSLSKDNFNNNKQNTNKKITK